MKESLRATDWYEKILRAGILSYERESLSIVKVSLDFETKVVKDNTDSIRIMRFAYFKVEDCERISNFVYRGNFNFRIIVR